jgi:Protein of unknown function (DUF3630)
MSILQRETSAGMEAVLDDNCGFQKFYKVAQTISEKLKLKFVRKEEDSDTMDWDFHYKGRPLTLHFNIYTGLSILPAKQKHDSVAALEFASLLQRKYYY